MKRDGRFKLTPNQIAHIRDQYKGNGVLIWNSGNDHNEVCYVEFWRGKDGQLHTSGGLLFSEIMRDLEFGEENPQCVS